MSESVQNNAEAHVGESIDHRQGSGEQASYHMPPNFGEMPSNFGEISPNPMN